jgi:hypothetical protein
VDQSVAIRLRAAMYVSMDFSFEVHDVSHRHLRTAPVADRGQLRNVQPCLLPRASPSGWYARLAYRVESRLIDLMEVLPSLISVRLDTAILGWGTNKPSRCLTTLQPKKWKPSPAERHMNSIKKFPTQRGLPSSTTKVRGVETMILRFDVDELHQLGLQDDICPRKRTRLIRPHELLKADDVREDPSPHTQVLVPRANPRNLAMCSTKKGTRELET